MLTAAIGFIQNVQLACFAIVFVLMAFLDRSNRSFRWLAAAYCAGTVGGIAEAARHILPATVSIPVSMIAAPIGYACIHAGIVHFLDRGRRTLWISLFLVLGTFGLFVLWAPSVSQSFVPVMDRMATFQDLALAIQTAISSMLLLSTRDEETQWPRRVMGVFLSFYSAVEFARVGVYLVTGVLPDRTAPWLETASGIVYVVSCSLLPMNFIWMQNARLLAHMSRQMTTDALTRLLNRRGLNQAGELEVARYLREQRDFAVALMDIDHFKHLNDTYGHLAGDQILGETAWLIRSLTRKSDTVGRLGGEEFVILLPNTSAAGASKLVENLRLALQRHEFSVDRRQLNITASFGLAVSGDRPEIAWDTLLKEADQALYQAKRDGRNLCRIFALGSAGLEPAASPDEPTWKHGDAEPGPRAVLPS